MVFQLRSQTWFQDLMKLRFLIAQHTSYSVRDKVIGKEWIYSDQRETCLQKASAVALKSGMVSFYGLGNFIGWVGYYFNYLGEGIEISRNWAITHFLVFWWSALEPPWSLWVCHWACWLGIKLQWKLTCLPSWIHLILIGLCCVLWLCHSFKSCALSFQKLRPRHSERSHMMQWSSHGPKLNTAK